MSSHPKIIEKIFIDTKKLGRESENPNLIEIPDARKKESLLKISTRTTQPLEEVVFPHWKYLKLVTFKANAW